MELQPREIDFLDWCRDHSIEHAALLWPHTDHTGRSVAVAESRPAGATVLTVPGSAVITPDKISGCNICESLRSVVPSAPDEALMAAYLVSEWAKGDSAEFAPYLKILPDLSVYNNMIEQWAHTECNELADNALTALAQRNLIQFRAEHAAIVEAMGQPVTFATYLWARYNVNSRVFLHGGAVASGSVSIAMVPFADMYVGRATCSRV